MSILNTIKSTIVSNQKAIKIGGAVLCGVAAVYVGWLGAKKYRAGKTQAEILATATRRTTAIKILNLLAKAYRVDSEVTPSLTEFKFWLDMQAEVDLKVILGSYFDAYQGMEGKIFVNDGRLCYNFDGETVSIEL